MNVLHSRPNLLFLIAVRKLTRYRYHAPDELPHLPTGVNISRVREFYIDIDYTAAGFRDKDEYNLFVRMNMYKPSECALFRKMMIMTKFRTSVCHQKLLRNGYTSTNPYIIFGKWHREDGPALLSIWNENYKKEWYINGLLHRVDGPAYEFKSVDGMSMNEWSINGKLHRLDGPAIERWNDFTGWVFRKWFIHGKEVDENDTRLIKK